jgi:hypothetical protein
MSSFQYSSITSHLASFNTQVLQSPVVLSPFVTDPFDSPQSPLFGGRVDDDGFPLYEPTAAAIEFAAQAADNERKAASGKDDKGDVDARAAEAALAAAVNQDGEAAMYSLDPFSVVPSNPDNAPSDEDESANQEDAEPGSDLDAEDEDDQGIEDEDMEDEDMEENFGFGADENGDDDDKVEVTYKEKHWRQAVLDGALDRLGVRDFTTPNTPGDTPPPADPRKDKSVPIDLRVPQQFLAKLFGHIVEDLIKGRTKHQQMEADVLSPLLPGPGKNKKPAEKSKKSAGPPKQSGRVVLTLDGDVPQINMLTEAEWLQFLRGAKVELMKFAAACSGSQQMNDVSTGFKVLKILMRNLKEEYALYGDFAPPAYMADLEAWLNDVTKLSASKKAIVLKFFKHAPVMLSTSFTPAAIKKSYAKSGFYPYNARQIMEQCTEWQYLSPEEQVRLLQVIEELIPIAASSGKVTEADQDRKRVGTNLSEQEIAKLDAAHASRQRCLWLNNEGFLLACALVREALEAEAKTKQERAVEAKENKEVEKQRKDEEKEMKHAVKEKTKAAKAQTKTDKAAAAAKKKAEKEGKAKGAKAATKKKKGAKAATSAKKKSTSKKRKREQRPPSSEEEPEDRQTRGGRPVKKPKR